MHPVHLHRHHFHVLKIAYPLFDPETGNSTAFNPDIRSLNEQCTKATWADPSWINGNNPGVNLVNPPLKDVVNVPANGYFIIRFMAENPGIQFYNIFLKIIFFIFFDWYYSFYRILLFFLKNHHKINYCRSMKYNYFTLCRYCKSGTSFRDQFILIYHLKFTLFHKFNLK